MPIRKPPYISKETLTRRTALEWLGKATVIALTSDLITGCAPVEAEEDDAVRLDAGGADAARGVDARGAAEADAQARDAASGDAEAPASPYPFEPGEEVGELYERWPIRTVDRQKIAEILSTWELTIDGLIGGSPKTLTFAELVALPRLDLTMDFHCVEGWSVHDIPYNGVHLSTLLGLVGGAAPEATHVNMHTIGGKYGGSLPLDVALEPHTLLAYGAGGHTLPLEHGFPLRAVVPRLMAYKGPKYITRLELTDQPTRSFWVQAGYSYEGEVPPERLREGRY